MPRSTKPSGFTLIELLVVISIIALLIGILLPALGAARDTARGIQCASMIRQFGIANAVYQADNDGWHTPIVVFSDTAGIVIPRGGAGGPPEVHWFNNYDFRTALGWSTDENDFSSKWVTVPLEYICPKAELAKNPENPANSYENYRRTDMSYGINIQRYHNGSTGSIPGKAMPTHNEDKPWAPLAILQGRDFSAFRESEIKAASEKISLGDSLGGFITKDDSGRYLPEMDEGVGVGSNVTAYRHSGGANILYFDGHASATPRIEIDAWANTGAPQYGTEDFAMWDILE